MRFKLEFDCDSAAFVDEVFWAWQQVKRNLGYDATLARFQ